MRIAFTYNLRRSDREEEAEFDREETIAAIALGLSDGGHEVERFEVSGPTAELVNRLLGARPDLVFNLAEGRTGRMREAFFPALFEQLGLPFTGSDAYVLTLTLDKWLTKLVCAQHGIDTPASRLVPGPADLGALRTCELEGLLPALVKPNHEGSSKGIDDASIAMDREGLVRIAKRALERFPAGLLVERYLPGVDVVVPFVEGVGDDGILTPADYVIDQRHRSRFDLYDYRLKNLARDAVTVRCPAALPDDVLARVRDAARRVVRALGLADFGRVDFRLTPEGRICLLDVNPLPSLERGASVYAAAALEGLSPAQTLGRIVAAAARRQGLDAGGAR